MPFGVGSASAGAPPPGAFATVLAFSIGSSISGFYIVRHNPASLHDPVVFYVSLLIIIVLIIPGSLLANTLARRSSAQREERTTEMREGLDAFCAREAIDEFLKSRADTKVFPQLGDELVEKIKANSPQNTDYLLVSAPEHTKEKDLEVLSHARAFIKEIGHDNLAGDAKDRFHTQVMDKARMTQELKTWREAWKGKVCEGVKQVKRFRPASEIVLLTIDGGPECQWELEELKTKIIPQFTNIRLRQHTDFESFVRSFVSPE